MVDENVYAKLLSDIVAALDKAGIGFTSDSDAMSAALVILQEMGRDRRGEQINQRRQAEHEEKKNPNAWRDLPATPRQLAFLTKHKIPFLPGIKKGPASDQIEKKVKEWQGEG